RTALHFLVSLWSPKHNAKTAVPPPPTSAEIQIREWDIRSRVARHPGDSVFFGSPINSFRRARCILNDSGLDPPGGGVPCEARHPDKSARLSKNSTRASCKDGATKLATSIF